MFEFGNPTTMTSGVLIVLAIAVGNWSLQIISERFSIDFEPDKWPLILKGPAYAGLVLAVMVFSSGEPTPFIYFQF